jgi:hypothetical protein
MNGKPGKSAKSGYVCAAGKNFSASGRVIESVVAASRPTRNGWLDAMSSSFLLQPYLEVSVNNHKFSQIVLARQACCRRVLVDKAKEYADNEDRLANFDRAGSLMDCSEAEALLGMMVKHWVSLTTMVQQQRFGVEYAPLWQEKITDAINYLHLLEDCLEEEFGPGAVERGALDEV